MNFQVTVLKILISYPSGFATLDDLKRDMAILATSGRDWGERTKRLASRVSDLNIFSQGLVVRENGGWRITEEGRAILAVMEKPAADFAIAFSAGTASENMIPKRVLGDHARWRSARLARRRKARGRARLNGS